MLEAAGLPHELLDARQHPADAEIVAGAGRRGRITVATGTAGRGTGIPLGEGVAEAGGLHVILTERHDAARVDRQLIGRSGRRGQPGSFELALSLEDPLLERAGGALATIPLRSLASWSLRFGSAPAAAVLRAAQRRTQRAAESLRFRMLRADYRTDDRLAFAGGRE
jgi:preprotein translocase subunit SecA